MQRTRTTCFFPHPSCCWRWQQKAVGKLFVVPAWALPVFAAPPHSSPQAPLLPLPACALAGFAVVARDTEGAVAGAVIPPPPLVVSIQHTLVPLQRRSRAQAHRYTHTRDTDTLFRKETEGFVLTCIICAACGSVALCCEVRVGLESTASAGLRGASPSGSSSRMMEKRPLRLAAPAA
jgi:hypothetical protein